MNPDRLQRETANAYIDTLRLIDLLSQLDGLLMERAAQVEAQRRGIEIGGEYLIRRPGLSVQRITVNVISGTAAMLKLQFTKSCSPSRYAVMVTPDTGVERIWPANSEVSSRKEVTNPTPLSGASGRPAKRGTRHKTQTA